MQGQRCQNMLTFLSLLSLNVCDHSRLKYHLSHQFLIFTLGCCCKVAAQNTSPERVKAIQIRVHSHNSLKNHELNRDNWVALLHEFSEP